MDKHNHYVAHYVVLGFARAEYRPIPPLELERDLEEHIRKTLQDAGITPTLTYTACHEQDD